MLGLLIYGLVQAQQVPIPQKSFWDINLGNSLTVLSVVVMLLTYRIDRSKDLVDRTNARDKMTRDATQMHTENKMRLETLGEFHKTQLVVNTKRDEQISLLSTQTATLAQMLAGMDRRVQLMEDRWIKEN